VFVREYSGAMQAIKPTAGRRIARYPVNLPAPSLVRVLQEQAAAHPDQRSFVFLRDGEQDEVALTYAELDRRARDVGAWLQSIGATGERVLLLCPPGLEYVTAFLGCLYGGAIAVPAYPPRMQVNRPMRRLQQVVADAQATVALTTGPVLELLESRLAEASELAALRWQAVEAISADAHHGWRHPDVSLETLAFLQYTSGSTAAPKGVMVTHRNILYNAHLFEEALGPDPNPTLASWLPLYHDMGLLGKLVHTLTRGGTGVLMSPTHFAQRPMRWLEMISRYRASISGAPNFAFDLCAQKARPEHLETLDLSGWRVAFSGAEPIRAETLERFAQVFAPCGFRLRAMVPCYGLAEGTLIVTGGPWHELPVMRSFDTTALARNEARPVPDGSEASRRLVGCGHNLGDQQIVIVDPETGERCRPGRVGEVWVSGESIAAGYWRNPEETKRAFRAFLKGTGEGPFLRTGDLGFLLDEELFITGRIKDLIIIDGRNQYPQDIEQTVEESHPALRKACCAAFSVERDGVERLVVAIEVEPRHLSVRRRATDDGADERRSTLDVREITTLVRRAVAREHDVPLHDLVLLCPGTIPKTSSGKIQRRACRAEYLSGELQVVRETDGVVAS
jgi:acyl-CoA synthetase (AMP-forming)/AMP-acid ligase II